MIRAELKFKNGIFIAALERVVYKSIAEYCRDNKLSYGTIIAYANLHLIPVDEDIRTKMIKTLYEDEYTLFTQFEDVVRIKRGTPKLITNIPIDKFIELDTEEVLRLQSPDQVDESMLKESLAVDVKDTMAGLKDRERMVLNMAYGMNGYHEHTLEEIGEKFELSRERVRQIREKALRRLRHSSKSKKLHSYVRRPPLETCQHCQGTGKSERFRFMKSKCEFCNGKGTRRQWKLY